MQKAINVGGSGDEPTKFRTHSLIIWWFIVCLPRPVQLWDQ
jgi:hypothetical protein